MPGAIDLPAERRAIVVGPEPVRQAVGRTLRRVGIETVLEASSPAEATARAHETGAGLTVVGQRLVDAAEVLACRAIRDALPASRLFTLTWYASGRDWLVSLVAGASACLAWQVRSVETTKDIVRRVLDGENLLTLGRPDLVQEVIGPDGRSLSALESEVAVLLARLHRDCEIATSLGVPLEEVRSYVKAIAERVALANRL